MIWTWNLTLAATYTFRFCTLILELHTDFGKATMYKNRTFIFLSGVEASPQPSHPACILAWWLVLDSS